MRRPDPVPVADADLVARDQAFVQEIDRVMEEAGNRCGAAWGCGPGRADCCIGPFPIRQLDAWRLRRGLCELARRDPLAAQRVERRSSDWLAEARSRAEDDLEDLAAGELDDDLETLAWLCDELADLACPALDPTTRRCDLYARRPRGCRTFGPPTRLADRDLSPCPFCFASMDRSELESLRVEPDREAKEPELEVIAERETGRSGFTFVALALGDGSDDVR